ncbi:MAG: bifunctional (p)ppGpp synthetase/guanosine-3',5'-bis(diphosphate) 3'-pyrophosphohydrolase [Candidatus Marinimicrobia bacterium]|jgi:GTP pyrophosphokinase|nr:bifunctional (p)ppGpp synthetase/guanosine-3',5'-bis(diphosphate) 3'-pyrophosphohydrolase [Candidatus Neomarinimicrobiota bacterium]MDX9778211.1 bifunctional (p)ppGpp synthetase/guanosine-3',5'-bis(diphosphate) 3'-pyrophosphohydrolase [bacterium]
MADVKETYPQEFETLIGIIRSYNHNCEADIPLLWKAFKFAREAHKDQYRQSGEPYFEHLYHTAFILADMLKMDTATICAGLLHDTLEDTNISEETLSNEFSPLISRFVKGVTKIGGIKFQSEEQQQAQNFRKMLLSVSEDIRVVLIKLADRLHNMRTLYALPEKKRRRIALETREVYAPLAHRLGINTIKSEMEDLSLKYLDPEVYAEMNEKITAKQKQTQKDIDVFTDEIKKYLAGENIKARVFGRIKNYYSIYNKMIRQNRPLEEIFDILAIRIIVESVTQCYAALGIVHQRYTPITERFRDFIATPKSNGYQSVHTTVIAPNGNPIEIQIRTQEMDNTAEVGIAAHWIYKEAGKPDELDKNIKWLREMVEGLKDETRDDEDFLHALKIDLYRDEIFVFTPKGDLIKLPVGATALDFAFAVHTEVGYRCIGAKVNGKIVSLNAKLSSGDRIEIITSNNDNVSYNWLRFVTTSRAQSRIRKWLQRYEFEQSIRLGEEILEKEMRKAKLSDKIKDVKSKYDALGFETLNLFYQAIGKGDITVRNIIQELYQKEEEKTPLSEEPKLKQFRSTNGISVSGYENMLVQLAKCCNPIPGDKIIGFITRGRGITVHRHDCPNIPNLEEEKDRFIDVKWQVKAGRTFVTRINIIGEDRSNLIYDVSQVIHDLHTNMLGINFTVEGKLARGQVAVMVESLRHAENIIQKLKRVSGVLTVDRT